MIDTYLMQYPDRPQEFPKPEHAPEIPTDPTPETPILPPGQPLIIPEEHPITDDPPVEIPEKETEY